MRQTLCQTPKCLFVVHVIQILILQVLDQITLANLPPLGVGLLFPMEIVLLQSPQVLLPLLIKSVLLFRNISNLKPLPYIKRKTVKGSFQL
jgi:hypothetical protein